MNLPPAVRQLASLLDVGQIGIDSIARLTGIQPPETLRRLFHKHLAVSPSACRDRFGAGARP